LNEQGITNTGQPYKLINMLKEFWFRFPVWFFYLIGLAVMNMLLTNVEPYIFEKVGLNRYWFVLPALLTFGWPWVYYMFRIHRSRVIGTNKAKHYAITTALLAAPYLFILLFNRPYYLKAETIRLFFEYSQFGWWVLVILHALHRRSWSTFVTFFVVAQIYGIVLENGGIIMGYFFEPHYRHYLWELPAPLCTVVGWAICFYCMASFTEYFRDLWPRLRGSLFLQALLATILAVTWDLFFDPFASLKIADGTSLFWHWNPKLPPVFLAEPLLNWVAWFSAFLPFSYAYFYFSSREDLTPGRMNWQILIYIPVVCVAAAILNFGIMAILEGGFDGPTFQILGDFWAKIKPYPV